MNTLLVGEKRGRISAAQTQSFIADLRTLEPEPDYSSIDHVMGMIQTISRDHRLTPYDALYVELAMRIGCPLATLDKPQHQAAQALGVECL